MAVSSKQKFNKSPGEDDVVAEMLNVLRDTEVLHKIFPMIEDGDIWPDEWIKSVYVPIHNK